MINETIDIGNASLHLLHSQTEKINSIRDSLDKLNQSVETSQTLLDTMLSFTYRIYYKYIKNKDTINNKDTITDIHKDTLSIKECKDFSDNNTISTIRTINKKINILLENQNKSLQELNDISIDTNSNLTQLNTSINLI